MLRRDFTTYFPDQAIKMEFVNLSNGRVKINTDSRDGVLSSVVCLSDFIDSCVNEAEVFFLKVEKLTGALDYEHERNIINAIKNKDMDFLESVVDE